MGSTRLESCLWILSIFMLTFVIAQNKVEKVNILFIYQDTEAERLFDIAMKYFDEKKNHNVEYGAIYKYFSNGSATDVVKLANSFCEELDTLMKKDNRPDVALDFTRNGPASESVKVVLKIVQMPTISGTVGQEGDIREWRDLTANQARYMIQIPPPSDIILQIVRSIVDIQNMTSAVVLFDEEKYEMYHKYKSLLQNMPTRHLLTKTEHATKLSDQISRLVHVDIVNFFIAGEVDQVSEVLDYAARLNVSDGPYFSDEFAWYSISLKVSDKLPRCVACEEPVTLVHLVPEKFPHTTRKQFLTAIISEDLSLTQMFHFDMTLNTILAVGNIKRRNSWNIDLVNNTCTKYGGTVDNKKSIYPDHQLDLEKEFKEVCKDNIMGPYHIEKNGKNYPKFNVLIRRLSYQPKDTNPRTNDTVGYWKAGFGEKALITFYGTKNLLEHWAHTVFRVVTYVQAPFVQKYNGCTWIGKGNKYNKCFYGYCIDLLEKIKEELQFNYTIRDVPDGYGYMNDTKPHEWNGMVRELKDRKADIALGAMSVMAERESVVDFTVPYYDLVGISILMKKPKTPTSLFKFLTVLENDVWMCILGAYFFTSFLMWIFDRWSPYSYQNNREKYEDDEEKREFNLKECLWFCMTSLTPQGGGEAPKNLSGRLVAATWWLFGFIIIASYTANLAAFLTVSRLDAPIESLEDLSKQYKIQYAPMNASTSSAWIYFDRMANIEHRFYEIWKDMSLNDSMEEFDRSKLAVWDYPVSDKYTKMWQAMMENNPPKSFPEAVERVQGNQKKNPNTTEGGSSRENDGFAFLGDATDIRYQVLTNCDLQMIGEEFSRKPYALAVQQGSPLKDQLNDAILKLLNQRFLELLKERWWNENPDRINCPKDDNQSDGISIHNIGGVFIVIFVGIVMACFTLIFEYWWYRKRNVSEELAEMALPPPKEFGAAFTSAPPVVEKTNFNTQYDKPPERTTLPSIENAW